MEFNSESISESIVLDTRSEATAVLSKMGDIISQNGVVSVHDFYELVGLSPMFADTRWGWGTLKTSSIREVDGGFVIDLPDPEQLIRISEDREIAETIQLLRGADIRKVRAVRTLLED